jgi:hypothetical protein
MKPPVEEEVIIPNPHTTNNIKKIVQAISLFLDNPKFKRKTRLCMCVNTQNKS